MDVHYLSIWCILYCIYCSVAQDDEKPSIYSLHINSNIRYRFATTVITSKIANPANVSREAIFDVDIPGKAFISNFSMDIGGTVYYGEVRAKRSAQQQYDEAKLQGESAGQITAKPNEYNKFVIAVNVAALNKVTFRLTYDELLERRVGLYNHELYINPGQPVRDVVVKITIQETRTIKDISVPTFTNSIPSVVQKAKMVTIDQPTPTTATILFAPTISQQDDDLAGKFIVQYDVERDYSVGDVYVVDGYFVHFFAPKISEEFPRDILFMLDTSTSMADRKLGQLKDAMTAIIKDLSKEDRFNIMVFNINQTFWADDFQPVTPGTKSKALRYIKALRTNQYTNLNSALAKGLAMFKEKVEGVPMMFLLTDGEPTTGTVSPSYIISSMKSANKHHIPIYSLAFGSGSDWNLMYRLSFDSGGVARRIFEGSLASLQIAQFYKEVSKVLLEDVTIQYSNTNHSTQISNEWSIFRPENDNVMLSGTEIIVAGKVEDTTNSIDLQVNATSVNGPVVLKSSNNVDVNLNQYRNILERLWAYLTIKEYLKSTAASNERRGDRSQAEILALKYGFVTPTTTMFIAPTATNLWKTFDEDFNELYLRTPRPTIKPRPTRPPRRWGGGGGGGGGGWGGGGGDPHFMIGLNNLDYPLCFDVTGEKDEVYTMFQDVVKDVTVNVRFDTGVKENRNGGKRVYIKEAAILHSEQVVYVTHDVIELDNEKYPWVSSLEKRIKGAWLIIDGDTEIVRVVFDNGLEAEVARRTHNKRNHIGDDFINVEVRHEEHASVYVTGLVGQFLRKNVELKLIRITESDTIVGHLILKHGDEEENNSRAVLVTRHDPVQKTKRQCWMLRKQGLVNLVNPDKYRIFDIFSH